MQKRIKRAVTALLLLAALGTAGCGAGNGPVLPPEKVIPPETAQQPAADTPIESPISSSRISFAAAGDNIIHEAVFTDAKRLAAAQVSSGGAAQDYTFSPMYAGLAELIGKADLAYVNHESPISSRYSVKGYPDFNSPTDAGRDLLAVGFDVINIANNHMLDMGEAGLNDSIAYWKATDAKAVLGACSRQNYDADNLQTVEIDGVKIAFLSYTTLINWSHANELSANSAHVVPYAKDADIKRQMALARESGADLIFVAMHWGDEGKFQPNAEQKRLAQLLADEGADVILGSHSHNIQPVEWLNGKNGNRTLVSYSTGNLISTMLYSYYMVGGILTFDIVCETGIDPYIDNVVFVPTMTHYSMTRDSLALYRLSDYTPELAKAHGAQLNGAFTYDTLKRYVTDTIPAEFLP